MTSSSNSPFDRCANCGRSFEVAEAYPVTTRRENEQLELHSFCDDECKEAWQSDTDAAGE